jgi:hypothetical protein
MNINQMIACLIKNNGNFLRTSKELDIPTTTLRRKVAKARAEDPDVDGKIFGTTAGLNDEISAIVNHADTIIPPGWQPYGLSAQVNYVDSQGVKKSAWVKSKPTSSVTVNEMDAYIERLNDIGTKITPLDIIPFQPRDSKENILSAFYSSDEHFGEYIWAKECGQDFSLDIARSLYVARFKYLISTQLSLNPGIALYMLNGDVLHYSGKKPLTEASGHLLDADSRQQKMIDYVVDSVIAVIQMLLENYPKVKVMLTAGNHDDSATHWLRVVIKNRFHNEPRLELNDDINDYQLHQHGKCMIAQTHGHLKGISKPESLALLYATRFADIWGKTIFRNVFLGHYHSLKTVEVSGCTLRQMRAMVPNDSYSGPMGYDSLQEASVFAMHKETGILQTNNFNPYMLQ